MQKVIRLLRIIRIGRWSRENCNWLREGETPADPLGDFATQDNNLSVWIVGDEQIRISRVVAALAGNRNKLDNFDYVLFDEDILKELAIKMMPMPGDSLDTELNRTSHRHLTGLTTQSVSTLVERVFLQAEERCARVLRDDVKNFISAGVKAGQIEQSSIRAKME